MRKVLLKLLVLVSFILLIFGVNKAKAFNEHSPEVKVYNSHTLHTSLDFQAFDQNFKGGSNTAVAKLSKDKSYIVVGAGPTGGPQVKIFTKSGKLHKSFFPFNQNFRGGVDVAAGDIDKDGLDELLFSQASHGQAWIKIYDSNLKIINNFLAFPENFQGGVNVAAGDINGDKKDEIIVGAGYGGGPHVRVFNKNGQSTFSTFPFDKSFNGGVDVAAGDFDKDGKDEIVASQAANGQAWIKVFKTDNKRTILGNFLAYNPGHKGGASVAASDINNDNKPEIITGAGTGGGPSVRFFKANGQSLNKDFFAFDANYKGGIKVAAGKFIENKNYSIIVSIAGQNGEIAKYSYPKYIEVSINNQTLKYFENGYKKGESLVSTGVFGHDTPLGTFNVFSKHVSMLMAGADYYLPGVPYVLSFLGPYTIHGTYWHDNFGHRMSHGCVNLPTPFAQTLYYWADIGTPVVIHP